MVICPFLAQAGLLLLQLVDRGFSPPNPPSLGGLGPQNPPSDMGMQTTIIELFAVRSHTRRVNSIGAQSRYTRPIAHAH